MSSKMSEHVFNVLSHQRTTSESLVDYLKVKAVCKMLKYLEPMVYSFM